MSPRRPDLSNAGLMAIDIETYDPLLEEGSGVYRKDGYILGVSIATDDFAEYYDFGHPKQSFEDKAANRQYIQDVLKWRNAKVGTKIGYDMDWLGNFENYEIKGKIYDISTGEALLNEYSPEYSLDFLSKKYLGVGKTKTKLEEWCEANSLKGDFREWLYMAPFDLVREYAIDDSRFPLQIHKIQREELEKQGLMDLYDMEMKVLRILLKARKLGVRIDRSLRNEYIDKLENIQMGLQRELDRTYGETNVNSGPQLANIFYAQNIPFPRTEKGNPSITKEFLDSCEHPLGQLVKNIREVKTTLNTFMGGAFLRFDVNGRIHGEFIPMKRDEGGTCTGRLSCIRPNLQQVTSPDRDKMRANPYGKMCRDIFIPEEDCDWGKIDYSQIEYRVIAHFATGPMSDEIRQQYRDNPKLDFHAMAQKWALEIAGTELSRSRAKNLGFGAAYFMGIKAAMGHFGWTRQEAEELFGVYFRAFPFMEPTRDQVVKVAKLRGYVRTPLMRRARLPENIKKAYILFNHLIQGTAADVMKKSMVDADEAGILFTELPFHVTVHDELGVSVPRTKRGAEAYKELKHIMENSVKLDVPMIADAELGPNWGSTKDVDLDALIRSRS